MVFRYHIIVLSLNQFIYNNIFCGIFQKYQYSKCYIYIYSLFDIAPWSIALNWTSCAIYWVINSRQLWKFLVFFWYNPLWDSDHRFMGLFSFAGGGFCLIQTETASNLYERCMSTEKTQRFLQLSSIQVSFSRLPSWFSYGRMNLGAIK